MSEAPGASSRWAAAEEGAELLREGEAERAVAELERVTAEDPNNEYAFLFLGGAWFERRDWERALKAYVRALEIQPRYLGAMVGAGHALRMMGRIDQAIRMGNQALLRQKNDGDALHLLGLLHFQRGDRDKSRQYLERFLETGPELETALEVEGMLQMLRGEVVELPVEDDT